MATIPASERERGKVLVLFDVDGTLTPARKRVSDAMLSTLAALRTKVVIGTVGGSDMDKQMEQLGSDVAPQDHHNQKNHTLLKTT